MSLHQTTRRRFLTATLATTGALLVPWRPAASATKVRIGWIKNQLHHTTFAYMAKIAEKHGFAVELVDFARYPDIMLALQSKQIDYGGIGYANLPGIVEQNLANVRAIAGNMLGAIGMIIRTGVKVETWTDYEGKKIAAASNSIVEHHIRVNAVEHGYDINKVEIVKMVPGPAALIALRKGEIDGISAWEPWVAQAVVEKIGYVPKIRVYDNSIGPINGICGASREFVDKHRDLTVQVVKALVEANAYLTKNPDEHARLALTNMSIELPVAQKAIENFRYDEKIYMESARGYAKVMHQYGLTKVDTSGRIDETVDWSFLEKATGKSPGELGLREKARML